MHIVVRKMPILLFLSVVWLGFFGFSLLDGLGILGLSDIGIQQSLATSQLVRSMFLDITILSALASMWILWDGYQSRIGKTLALPFALLTLFMASAGLLLYLIVRVASWEKDSYSFSVEQITKSWNAKGNKQTTFKRN